MSNALERLIKIKTAELEAVALALKQPNERVRTLAEMQPGTWVEQLAQLAALCEYADSLPAEFAGFVAEQLDNNAVLIDQKLGRD